MDLSNLHSLLLLSALLQPVILSFHFPSMSSFYPSFYPSCTCSHLSFSLPYQFIPLPSFVRVDSPPIKEDDSFLVADTRLYTLLCQSVGRSVTFVNYEWFMHKCSCPTVRDRIAVYPVWFLFTSLFIALPIRPFSFLRPRLQILSYHGRRLIFLNLDLVV